MPLHLATGVNWLRGRRLLSVGAISSSTIKGRVKERWGRLTDDDLTAIAGRRDQLEGMIQERYGYAKERARNEIEDWYRSMESNLAEQIEPLRSGIQSLSSTVEQSTTRPCRSALGAKAIECRQISSLPHCFSRARFRRRDEAVVFLLLPWSVDLGHAFPNDNQGHQAT